MVIVIKNEDRNLNPEVIKIDFIIFRGVWIGKLEIYINSLVVLVGSL